ncbi:hypothetical protein FGA82_29535 [Pseudomonas fluorescens]|nr:hypothetical protein FGA82_29535 [Pseudomonas fluorescens]
MRRTLWERACSRKRSVSQPEHRLTGRLREQARSHREFRCYQECRGSFSSAHNPPPSRLLKVSEPPNAMASC